MMQSLQHGTSLLPLSNVLQEPFRAGLLLDFRGGLSSSMSLQHTRHEELNARAVAYAPSFRLQAFVKLMLLLPVAELPDCFIQCVASVTAIVLVQFGSLHGALSPAATCCGLHQQPATTCCLPVCTWHTHGTHHAQVARMCICWWPCHAGVYHACRHHACIY